MGTRYRLRGDVTKADLREMERLLAVLWNERREAKGDRERYNAARRYEALKVVVESFIPESAR